MSTASIPLIWFLNWRLLLAELFPILVVIMGNWQLILRYRKNARLLPRIYVRLHWSVRVKQWHVITAQNLWSADWATGFLFLLPERSQPL